MSHKTMEFYGTPTEVHFLWDQETDVVDGLKDEADLKSICIDKDIVAELLLRLTLDKKGILLSDSLKIHAWSLKKDGTNHYFFTNDQQNDLLKAQHPTACNL